jgi:hypothetical protein
MSKRELIETGTDKRYVRRDEQGQFESVDVSRSLFADARHDAKPGQGVRFASADGPLIRRLSDRLCFRLSEPSRSNAPHMP